jgi:hypothetical protein
MAKTAAGINEIKIRKTTENPALVFEMTKK